MLLVLELEEGLLDLGGSRVGEAREGDIATVLAEDTVVGDGIDLDLLPAELDQPRLSLPWTLDEDADLAAWCPLEGCADILGGRATEVLAINL